MDARATESRSLPRNVRVLGFVSLLTDTSSEMIYPLLPIFLTKVLGAGPAFLGLIEGIAEATASILKLASGALTDLLGRRKPLVLLGYSLSTLSRPLMAVAQAPLHVLLIRFSDRIGKGIRGAPRDALIVDVTHPDDRGRAFGYQRAMDHTGAVLGPLIGFAAVTWLFLDLRTIFALAAIPGVLAVIAIIRGVDERRSKTVAARPGLQLSWSGIPRRYTYYLAVVGVFALSNSSDAFLLLRATDVGFGTGGVLLLWSLLHVVKAGTSVVGGTLSDRIGRKALIIAGWAVYAGTYACFAVASEPWHVVALFAIYGVYFGCTEGVERALVADLTPSGDLRGRAFGLYHFVIGVAALPSSLIMGLLYGRFGPPVAFGFGASLAILSILLLIPMRTSREG